MKKIGHILFAAAIMLSASCGKSYEAEIGAALPSWSEGCLDIHLINSGNGECNFLIMPDGTTMLVDAGEMPAKPKHVQRRPDASVRAYKVYSNYISHFLPSGRTSIDWCLVSHFHIDHIGTPRCSEALHPEGGHALSGLTAVYNDIPFDRLLDNGYPDYEADTTNMAIHGEMVTNPNRDWQKFVRWAVGKNGMQAERFNVGEEQITLVNDKDRYSNFRIFNFIGNNRAWTMNENGNGEVRDVTGGRKDLQGNPTSAGFHISYGDFDFISAGDLEKKPQSSLAYYYRDFVEGGLDVFKGNHHLNVNSWGSKMREFFDPRVIVAHTTKIYQPDIPTFHYIMDGELPEGSDPVRYKGDWSGKLIWEKDVFVTNLDASLAEAYPEEIAKLSDYNGHIVIRVIPGGSEFYVYMLDDNNFDYKVKSIHGPYKSK